MPALVAIIGRPNVGKSTLFNRLLGERRAIESPIAGTTRDPITAFYTGEKVDFLLVDTGGIEFGEKKGMIELSVEKQARLALRAANLIIFCLDTRQELTSADYEVVTMLRKNAGKTPVLLVGTKAEGKAQVVSETDLSALGISDFPPILVVALQNIGVFPLLHEVESILVKRGFIKDTKSEDPSVSIAIVGRPNVGKSSLINALTNSEKLIVSEIAGTTRDAVDLEVNRDGKLYRLIDTAGIRRKSRVDELLEEYSILRSLASLRRADVAVMVLDAVEGVTHQDKHIIDHVLEAETGLIILVNKWDLMEKGDEVRRRFLTRLQHELNFTPWAAVYLISAQEKKNIHHLFSLAEEIKTERKKRISTGQLNSFLQEAQALHPISGVRNARPRIKYGTQVGTSPPHFVFHGGRLDAMHFSSRRYLENRLRDAFGFAGTPIRIEMVTTKNPYQDKKTLRSSTRVKAERKRKEKGKN